MDKQEYMMYFMKNDRNSLGVKSLEGLEKGNYNTKIFDQFYTYKGDRKKANRGVFKLLRLKSNRTLRAFQTMSKRIQRCSRCKRIGHNATNKSCPAIVDITDLIEDDEKDAVEEVMDTAEAHDEDDILVNRGDEGFADIDELLESDEELF